jgi:hypothetical protein
MLKMLVRMAWSVGLLTLLISSCPEIANAQAKPSATSAQSASSHAHTAPKARLKGKKQKEKEVVHIPPPPTPPPTPEQMPAQTPEVSFIGGLLTINAHNSTMNDVLAAVRRVTGASIEKPPMGGTDRVVVHLGPGQPKDVLSALFNGSRYDYIILGPMGQPGGVQRVILTARSSMPAQSPTMANVPNGQPQPAQQDAQDNTSDTEDMTVPEQNQPEPEQPAQDQPQEQPQAQPANPEQQPQAQPQQSGEDQSQQPHVKSPEELLRELQQMQQQQQQQNQQNQPQSPQ